MKVTLQEPNDSVQFGALKVPAEPVLVKLTVPVGVTIIPGDVSDTVAVHVDA